MKLYVGTYTRPVAHVPEPSGDGLYVLEYDQASGAVSIVQEVIGPENPAFLCISPDGRTLHAVWEVPEWPEGLVASYAIDGTSGEIRYLGVQGARGSGSAYVAMDSGSRAALVANYGSGSVAMLPARTDGSLMEASSVDQHAGGGPNGDRQEGPHAHCVVLSPDDRFAFSADLGADTVYTYRVDYDRRLMERIAEVRLPAGSGPRHIAFAPSRRYAYVLCELDSSVAVMAYDAEAGGMGHVESVPLLPGDFSGENLSADIHVHPSGRFLYGSNRGHDSIAMFEVDASTGQLGLIGHRSTEGATPRNFVITPDGRYLLVANQDSDNVVTLPIDAATGQLGETVAVADVPTPVCLKFGR